MFLRVCSSLITLLISFAITLLFPSAQPCCLQNTKMDCWYFVLGCCHFHLDTSFLKISAWVYPSLPSSLCLRPSYEMVYRQPFPGPGLGVRCLGAITRDRLEAVRESDAILREEFAKAGLDKKVWQYFTVVPDFKSVGVKDNARSYDWPVIIRAVNTIDAMTATIEHIDWEILDRITRRILAEVDGVNRVCYDMSPKPSATIEWE